MSKKILRPIAAVAAIVANFVLPPGIGQIVSAAIAVASAAFLKPKAPRVSSTAVERLNATLDPNAPRKISFGHTALAADVRYQAFTGTDQEFMHWIVCAASHGIQSFDEIWFDSEKAWSSAGGVTAKFAGYLEVTLVNPGTAANGIAIDSVWTSTATLTGCAYFKLRFKLTGNSKKAESPFAQSVPTRMTIRGRGAKLPDLREVGVSATDQATWSWFDDDSGRNPAWQLLFYLLGWKINGILAVGRGIPADRIDLDSFITAANMCDEPVTLAGGGTEPRYRSDGVFSESDDPGLVIGNLTAAMNAVLRDTGGKIAVHVFHNDLASPVADFSETDILGEDEWMQTPPPDETFNVVRGRYTDPTDAGLYQLVDYPPAEIASVDGIERPDTFELPMVQSPRQAQRLAKQRLQRSLYPGLFAASFNERGWQVNLGDPVRLSHVALGWSNKLFRVVSHSVSISGVVSMTLREEHADIYQWDAEESPAVSPAAPTSYDALNSPLVQALQEVEALQASMVGFLTNEAHTVPADSAGNVSSYSGATGGFVLYSGTTDVSDQFTLSTATGGNPQALTVSYNNTVNPRTFTVTAGLGAAEENATLTISASGSGAYAGIVIQKVFTLAKSKTGAGGAAGANAKLLYVYSNRQTISYDETGALSPASQTTTFTATKQNTSGTVAWTLTDSLGNVLAPATYLSATSGDSVNMTAANFNAAIAVNGAQGVIVTGTISADGLTDRISVLKVQKGATGAQGVPGDPGAPGANNAVVYLYRRSATSPTMPTGTFTYTFATGVLSGGTLNGWTQAIPAADGNPLWVIAATASANTATDSIAAAEFSAPVIQAGSGLNIASVFLYQRTGTATPPAVPAGDTTYTFQTGVLTGTLGAWTQAVPPLANGPYLWLTSATAVGTAATDTIATGEWAAVQRFVAATLAELDAAAAAELDAAKQDIADIIADDVVTRSEKLETLIPFYDRLQARYDTLTTRASALAISTTAAANARTNFIASLNALSPAWDHPAVDSSWPATIFADADFPTGWTVSNAATAVSGEYIELTDSSTTLFGLIDRDKSQSGANIYSAGMFVDRDAVGKATRHADLRLQGLGGTVKTSSVRFDTSTGETANDNAEAVGAIDMGTEWFVYVQFTTNGDNTSVRTRIVPAAGTNLGAQSATATGSIRVRNPIAVAGTYEKLGRAVLIARMEAYDAALDALAKSISEKDGTTSLQISGSARLDIAANNDGTIKTGQLPKASTYTAKIGLGTVVPTWSVTVTSGTATATISTGGVLSITAFSGTSAKLRIDAVYNGVTQSYAVDVTRKDDPPPTGGGGTGGSGGSASDSTINFANSSSYGAANTGILLVAAGAAGEVDLAAPLSFICIDNLTDASVGCFGKWQWRVVGGVFADVAAETAHSVAASVTDEGGGIYSRTEGAISVNATKTGLTDGVQYEFQLLLRVAEASRSIEFTGTASGQGQ